jgi:hypothetical protein
MAAEAPQMHLSPTQPAQQQLPQQNVIQQSQALASPESSISPPPPPPPTAQGRREAHSAAGRQHNERQTSDSTPNSRAAVAVACVACRNRHLKCDGATQCGRCAAEGIPCSYVKSRRGWKGPRKNLPGSYLPNGQGFNSKQPLLLNPCGDIYYYSVFLGISECIVHRATG